MIYWGSSILVKALVRSIASPIIGGLISYQLITKSPSAIVPPSKPFGFIAS